jgi:predicted TIM-barrel fold metal-dependent hydrolase
VQIDVHAHALPPDLSDLLARFGHQDVGAAQPMPVIEERIAEMDQHEIDIQVLSLPNPQIIYLAGDEALAICRYCNDYLAWLVEQYPGRFRALASIPLNTGMIDDAVRELNRCVEELGMTGFSTSPNVNGTLLDDPALFPFHEEANRLGTTMMIHPEMKPDIASVTMGLFDTSTAVSRLIFSNFFGRFLSIKVIATHLGGALPYIAGAMNSVEQPGDLVRPPGDILQDLYVDTVLATEPALQCALDTVGVNHVLFGSGYPDSSAGITGSIDQLEEMKLGRRDKRRILGDNAAELLNINENSESTLLGSILGMG